ncbi:MAG: phosphoenolpyruvate carboxykinase (GTP) [Eubacteriales bacterium]|jgi:phosphoenolpyruvate carboxykinase (GTP)|nr:phosphoenolpyruvate carboxykinase (GTP) [Eubacteriales bacterium]
MTNNQHVLDFVKKYTELFQPDDVVWIDAGKQQYKELVSEAIATGEVIKLNNKLLPGCLYHRTQPDDVARVENRTFICSRDKEDAGPTNNWMDPTEAYATLDGLAKGAMKGRTMYVIPFSMGKIGSPFAKYGIELTDSIYVVLNMMIMTRVSPKIFDKLGDSDDFVRGIHSKCTLDANNKYICQFPEDNTIYSLNSGYGGNVLLGKKCFALRIASYQGWKEGWMAEHMLILGVEKPDGDIKYITAAFPSACGKTNLAMLIPPKCYSDKGYKIWTVGDDIAWIRKGRNSMLYAVNPENGFFGVAPGTNAKSNYNALMSAKRNAIFTNVALDVKNKTVWWEGMKEPSPAKGEDWKGNPWYEGKLDENGQVIKGAHPNSRFTAPAKNCPCLSKEFENPRGVPVSAIIFGGRRAKATPLVYEARDWEHGVFIGSIMASETTAAAAGKVGVVRHDPMAMLPFCGYNMGDYFQHWLDMGRKVKNKPKIFNVNWFRTDDSGNFIWPGFGDNMRVLDWIIRRCEGTVDAVESPIGLLPRPEDINLEGMDGFTVEDLKKILDVDTKTWKAEAKDVTEYYKIFGDKLPAKLSKQLRILKRNLKESED